MRYYTGRHLESVLQMSGQKYHLQVRICQIFQSLWESARATEEEMTETDIDGVLLISRLEVLRDMENRLDTCRAAIREIAAMSLTPAQLLEELDKVNTSIMAIDFIMDRMLALPVNTTVIMRSIPKAS